MPTAVTSTRLERFTDEFTAMGMSPEAADELSCHLIIHYPLSARIGFDSLAHEIENRGMEAERARDAAALVFAIESLDRGMCFDLLIEVLEAQDLSAGEALAGAIEGSRFRRECQIRRRTDTRSTTHLISALGAAGLATLALIRLLQSGF